MRKTKWNPHKETLRKIYKSNYKEAYKIFRNSSSGYISKPDVREYVFFNHGRLCSVCNDRLATEIDHVKSVYSCFKDKEFEFCNSLENLKPICKYCNTSKKP